MDGPANRMARDVVNGGGSASSSTNGSLIGSVAEEVVRIDAASASNRVKAGWSELHAFPGTVTDLAGRADITVSSAAVQWSTPGYDGSLGAHPAGTVYYINIASYTAPDTFGLFSQADTVISTSGMSPGALATLDRTGLIANTSYYAQLWTLDADGNLSLPYRSTFTTLANPPALGLSEFLFIQRSSVAVAWAAHPGPPDASSKTCEGYVLRASSNNFGVLAPAGAPVFSSTTYSFLASTLTVGSPGAPLDLANTYYFQVGSLNHAGQPNYTQLGRLNFQILQSTGLLHLGAMDPFVATSTVSMSSMVVVNLGNWPATIELAADMATVPASPWTLSTAPGVETAALMGVWRGGLPAPPPTAFNTYITPAFLASQAAGNYSDAQNGYQIPAGQDRTLWFRFFLPTTSSSLGPETIKVTAQPVYP